MSDVTGAGGDLPWLDASGPDAELVISTRVRLARNLAGYPFWGRNSVEQREAIVELVAGAATTMPALSGATLLRLDGSARTTRRWLNERQLISRDLVARVEAATSGTGAALLTGPGGSVMINEEDHLRLQALRSGFDLDAAYAVIDRMDEELGARICFAFHPQFGYLTACPTNVGTGLRASVLIHLPALEWTQEITKVLQGMGQVGLTWRGLFGEGSAALGSLFQLSNQTTLGKSEPELLDHLSRMVRQVLAYEERAREALRRDAGTALEDRVWRAWGTLRHARTLQFEELVTLLSAVRLGVGMRLLPSLATAVLNRVLVQAQDAHLSQCAEIGWEDASLPQHRATLVRGMFEEAGA